MQQHNSTRPATSASIPISHPSVSSRHQTSESSTTTNLVNTSSAPPFPSYIDTSLLDRRPSTSDAVFLDGSDRASSSYSGTRFQSLPAQQTVYRNYSVPSHAHAVSSAQDTSTSGAPLGSSTFDSSKDLLSSSHLPLNFDFGGHPFPLFSEIGHHAATDPGYHQYEHTASMSNSPMLARPSASDAGHRYMSSQPLQLSRDPDPEPMSDRNVYPQTSYVANASQTQGNDVPTAYQYSPLLHHPKAQAPFPFASSAFYESDFTNESASQRYNQRDATMSSPASDTGEHGHGQTGTHDNRDYRVQGDCPTEKQSSGDVRFMKDPSVESYSHIIGREPSYADEMEEVEGSNASTSGDEDKSDEMDAEPVSKGRSKGKNKAKANAATTNKASSVEQRIRNRQSSQRHRIKIKQRADDNEKKVKFLEAKVRQLEQELNGFRQATQAGHHEHGNSEATMNLLREENQMLRQKVHLAEQELCRFNNMPQLATAPLSGQHNTGQASFTQGYASTSNYIPTSTLHGRAMSPSFAASLMVSAGVPQQTTVQPRGQHLNIWSNIQLPAAMPATPSSTQYAQMTFDSLLAHPSTSLSAPATSQPTAAALLSRPFTAAAGTAPKSMESSRVYINPYAFGVSLTPASGTLPEIPRPQTTTEPWQRRLTQSIAIQPAPLLRRQRAPVGVLEAPSHTPIPPHSDQASVAAPLLDIEEMIRSASNIRSASDELGEG